MVAQHNHQWFFLVFDFDKKTIKYFSYPLKGGFISAAYGDCVSAFI
jgi:hypothetical protein